MGVSGVYNLQELVFILEECINVIINGCKVMIVFEVLLDEKEIKVVVKYIMKFGEQVYYIWYNVWQFFGWVGYGVLYF